MAIQSKNPYTNKVEKIFEPMSNEKIDEAILRADKAYKKWKETSISERAKLMTNVVTELMANPKKYASIMTIEMGKLLREGIEWEIPNCADMCEYYARNAERFLAPEIIEDVKEGEAYLEAHPIGVIFGVMPWNFPFYQIIRFIAPNIMAGNVVLFKHASNVPQAAQAVEKLFLESGFPEGVVTNLLITSKSAERVIKNPIVRGVSLTGSERAGAAVASLAGKNLKKAVMELGGSDAFIVLEDADLDKVAEIAITAKMFNSGEVCTGSKRYIVVDSVYDAFLEGFKKDMAKMKPGDPMDLNTDYAPMVSEEECEKLLNDIKQAIEQGATLEVGGKREDLEGAWLKPTIISNVTKDMDIYYKELFGPAAMVFRAKDAEDAVRIANDSPFGLSSAIMSEDIENAKKIASKIESGVTFINSFTISEPCLPFGGVKNSGFGKELGKEGMEEFINRKLIRVL
ncbi:NAD-dependent succinate-semialdehyde dehydrogenase [Clostridium oceanicum]|uniref:NAD-dependent succinate-semialdehyde dehydrogenase n=1 Tax=Clostridium oceanicum TaxID=1543 RepID=A0ABN1JL50_9CLOT